MSIYPSDYAYLATRPAGRTTCALGPRRRRRGGRFGRALWTALWRRARLFAWRRFAFLFNDEFNKYGKRKGHRTRDFLLEALGDLSKCYFVSRTILTV